MLSAHNTQLTTTTTTATTTTKSWFLCENSTEKTMSSERICGPFRSNGYECSSTQNRWDRSSWNPCTRWHTYMQCTCIIANIADRYVIVVLSQDWYFDAYVDVADSPNTPSLVVCTSQTKSPTHWQTASWRHRPLAYFGFRSHRKRSIRKRLRWYKEKTTHTWMNKWKSIN